MSSNLLRLFLVRHGDTAWTDSGQHTGRTDIPLNERGEEHARWLGEELGRLSFVHVFTSPLQRAAKTCQLAGFGYGATVDADLVEWDYGRFEGKRTKDILEEAPNWELFRDGCPEGESASDVASRADRFIARVRAVSLASSGTGDEKGRGDVLAFSSGHIIRMIAGRWLGLSPASGRVFFCQPASVGVLGYEHNRVDQPIILLWNYSAQSVLVPPIAPASTRTGDGSR